MARIGIMTSRDISYRNLEHIIFRIGTLLSIENEVELVCAKKTSVRIAKSFYSYSTNEEPPAITKYLPFQQITSRVHTMRRYIRERKPDLIMAISSIGVNGLAAAIAGKLEGTPVVTRLTSDVFRVYRIQRPLKKMLSLYIRNNILGRLTIRLSTKVIVFHEGQLEELCKMGVPRYKLYVAPQPVEFPELSNGELDRREVRQKLKIPLDAYVIGTTLRLDPDKKIDLLEEVISQILSQDPSIYFVLVGQGSLRPKLEVSFKKQNRVIFIDQLARDDLAKYYVSFDKVFHPSGSEGLANTIIEPMYFGIPVIATDSGIITRSIVSHVSNEQEEIITQLLDRSISADSLPTSLTKKKNKALWLDLIRETYQQL